MTIEALVDEIGWSCCQVGILCQEKLAQLEEEPVHLVEQLTIVGTNAGIAESVNIDVDLYWATGVDVLFWPKPAAQLYPGAIMFSSYGEFVLWLTWRLRARFDHLAPDEERLMNEMEGWRIKALSPRPIATKDKESKGPPMTSDVELL